MFVVRVCPCVQSMLAWWLSLMFIHTQNNKKSTHSSSFIPPDRAIFTLFSFFRLVVL